MNWYPVDTYPLDCDLGPLLIRLQQQGLLCRVTEEAGGQRLWLSDPQQAEKLRDWIQSEGLESFTQVGGGWQEPAAGLSEGGQYLWRKLFDLQRLLYQYPITLTLLLLGALGALLVYADPQLQWVRHFTYQPLQVSGSRLTLFAASAGWQAGEYWRLLTPVFLHFGLFHILFNGLWVWEFGRRIESSFGSGFMLLLAVFLALASNAVQYWWQGPSLFGGLSGVLYGLLGFLWIYQRRQPRPELSLPAGIIGFMLVWMVLGMTGVIDAFMDGSIANAAHFGGLLSGMLAAWLTLKLNLRSRLEQGRQL